MSHSFQHVALVGRPNVGKSRLFNRLVGKRLSIVHDQPGVTRDIVSAEIDKHYMLLDTGGLGMEPGMTPGALTDATVQQVDFALASANLILLVVDSQSGCTLQDKVVAEKLRSSGKRVIVVANKVDQFAHEQRIDAFYELGLGEPVGVSAEHGKGIEDLKEHIAQHVGPKPELRRYAQDKPIKICFVGRPNVGKSSLSNRLLDEDRLIVSEIPGTTRDAVTVKMDYTNVEGDTTTFALVDTAGLRFRKKMDSSVEFFSAVRSEAAMTESDVVFLVLDARDGVTKLDKKLAGALSQAGKGFVVVVNKWDYALKQFKREPLDGFEDEAEFREAFVKAIRKELFSLPESEVVFTSAKDGYQVNAILDEAKRVYERMNRNFSTSKINKTITSLMDYKAPSVVHGKRFKVYYALQTGCAPVSIKIFCNQTMRLQEPYRRYLEKGFIEAFDLKGCPIKFDLVGKEARYTEVE